jgi:hypothetical protein
MNGYSHDCTSGSDYTQLPMFSSARHGQRELFHFFLLMLSRWALMVAYAQLWERAHEIAMVLLCCEAPVLLVLTSTKHYIIIGDRLPLAMARGSIRNTVTTLDIIWTAIVGGGVRSALWLDGDKYAIPGAISDLPCPLTTIFSSFFPTEVSGSFEADTVLPFRLQPRQL